MTRLILGHTTHNSAKIWIRGSRRWPFAFIDVLDAGGNPTAQTKPIELEEEDFYTGVITWGGLQPNQPYRTKVAFGKRRNTPREDRVREAYTEGNFHTFPEPDTGPNFSFILGSCNLHSLGVFEKPDKAWIRISDIARTNHAQFMIHGGDQIYADVPFSPSTSYKHYRDKYLDAWEDCRPAQRVLTELPHYMILDDHEITNNFDHDSGDNDQTALLNVAMKVYYEFQHKHNPNTPTTPRRYYYTFNYGKVQFFVMDTRYHRESSCNQMIEPAQLTALKGWLTRHADSLKFVVTSVPFVSQVKRPKKDKWCDPAYARQRAEILQHILNREIRKVVFLTGDMHTSYYANMKITDGNRHGHVHELMSSPINQITPDTTISDKYLSPHQDSIGGVDLTSTIEPNTFYGNHSNIMAIEIDGDDVTYRIYRTTRGGGVAATGTFSP